MAKKTNASLKSVHKAFQTKMDSLVTGNQSFKRFVKTIKKNGQNSVFQRSRLENKTYDDKWVRELEIGFDAIDRIITHPRTFIKETQDLVLAGQAKKINSTSIRHLASHTRYIHGFNKEGQIVPERILSIGSDVDVQIYENRVLMSLIQRLTFFVEKRIRFISEKGETRNSDVLFIHSKTEIDGVRYEMDNRLKISVESDDKGDYEKNTKLLATINNLNDRVNFYTKSPFMADMIGAKSVHSPIAMTNLLLKNPDYHKVAVLWKFIDSYTKLGITFDIEEKKGVFDEKYFNEIYGLTAASLATLHSNLVEDRYLAMDDDKENEEEEDEDNPLITKRRFEPKVMLSLEDEVFLTHKFRYDQFPEYEDTLYDPERSDEEADFALTPEEVKRFKDSDSEYLTKQLMTAKELRDQAEEERNAMDHEATIKEFERRRKEEQRRQEEHEKELQRRLEEEKRALAELEKRVRLEAEQRLERENELLRQARERIIKAAQEDASIDDMLAEHLSTATQMPHIEEDIPLPAPSVEPTATQEAEPKPVINPESLVETKTISKIKPEPEYRENTESKPVSEPRPVEYRDVPAIDPYTPEPASEPKDWGYFSQSYTANESDELRRIRRLLREKDERIASLEEALRNKATVYSRNAGNSASGVKIMPKIIKAVPGMTPTKKYVPTKKGTNNSVPKPSNRVVILPLASKSGSKKGVRFVKSKK